MEGKHSPEYVRLSLAAAIVLGAQPGRFYRDVRLGCINLLLTYAEGCYANCAYCGLARGREGEYSDKSFIRVDWPTLRTEEVVDRMARYSDEVTRVCVSMVSHPHAYQDTRSIIGRIRHRLRIPISALIAPNLFHRERLVEFRELGVDMLGVGLDAASERIFERTRGRSVKGPLSWRQYWDVIAEARDVFGPFKVNAHLVVGIGETDRDFVEVLSLLQSMEINAYLFCFYPEGDSPMSKRRRPSLRRYRRIQLVKYLMENGLLGPEQLELDEADRIHRLHISTAVVEQAIARGDPFLTDGCPGESGETACTRPFGSYRPGEPFRDFPFRPTEDDLSRVDHEIRWRELVEGVTRPAG